MVLAVAELLALMVAVFAFAMLVVAILEIAVLRIAVLMGLAAVVDEVNLFESGSCNM